MARPWNGRLAHCGLRGGMRFGTIGAAQACGWAGLRGEKEEHETNGTSCGDGCRRVANFVTENDDVMQKGRTHKRVLGVHLRVSYPYT